jgi:hypothetical protein
LKWNKKPPEGGTQDEFMELQSIIVALIILTALVYAGNILRHKIKAFKPKDNSCGADCGCDSKTKVKIL